MPDLEGEIWKPITEDDHKILDVPMSKTKEYWVSNMEKFKTVTKSTKNAKITNYQGRKRPQILLIRMVFYFIVALVFHRDQLDAKIAELKIDKQKNKFGIIPSLHFYHIDSTNHCANDLQFLTPQENIERSLSRRCRIWEENSDTKKEYRSLRIFVEKKIVH